jgi:hypothetical protein
MICLSTKFHTPNSDDYLVFGIKKIVKKCYFKFCKDKNHVNKFTNFSMSVTTSF